MPQFLVSYPILLSQQKCKPSLKPSFWTYPPSHRPQSIKDHGSQPPLHITPSLFLSNTSPSHNFIWHECWSCRWWLMMGWSSVDAWNRWTGRWQLAVHKSRVQSTTTKSMQGKILNSHWCGYYFKHKNPLSPEPSQHHQAHDFHKYPITLTVPLCEITTPNMKFLIISSLNVCKNVKQKAEPVSVAPQRLNTTK